ncbi:uncharacterized protein DUF4202 [Arcticibacter pallidicorallinus]|uniref:Uncharacterized protein DUF4202 n=1 Tax=Arcticibacter pallidicorallinus TaxID=1259464 RepID=A0A2T0TXE8_9SPHI|nr:DUF4202 domain-containing protein [Arcticibacter pallidicorallinus]PRY50320.1 uncharacterized protein DUF4202 [Arcticibacter pallidicorallinus]
MNRLQQAFELFDKYNKQSPEQVVWNGETFPSEYFYAVELYNWVRKIQPDANEYLLLASRSQHIGRWEIPRSDYPEGRTGYLKWRSDLGKFHAQKAGEILQGAGYSPEEVERVQQIIQKQRLKLDADVQTIENALCLVFLEFQYDDLIRKLSEEKMINVLRKTWKKMSKAGHDAALQLQYSPEGSDLIAKALQE